VLKFRILGNLRFLSHRETLAMFHRVFVRAGVNLCYSQGFNPHPAISLPLPRSVGMRSEDELLYALLADDCTVQRRRLNESIGSELPTGCEILQIDIIQQKVRFNATSAVYEFPLSSLCEDKPFKANIERLQKSLASDAPLIVSRRGSPKKSWRQIDIRSYIDSVECKSNMLFVRCNITPTGSVRVDEILQLLEIEPSGLCGPINRKSVQWISN